MKGRLSLPTNLESEDVNDKTCLFEVSLSIFTIDGVPEVEDD